MSENNKEYYDLIALIARKRQKIGFAEYNPDKDALYLKADGHYDASKLGRALMNGKIKIEKRVYRPKEISNYTCAADEFDGEATG